MNSPSSASAVIGGMRLESQHLFALPPFEVVRQKQFELARPGDRLLKNATHPIDPEPTFARNWSGRSLSMSRIRKRPFKITDSHFYLHGGVLCHSGRWPWWDILQQSAISRHQPSLPKPVIQLGCKH